jgi:tetratricopeptide (TPR) repeat protein
MVALKKTTKTALAFFLAVAFFAGPAVVPVRADGHPAGPQRKKKVADEKNPQYQYELGVIALRYGLPDEAIRYGELAVSLDPAFFNGWNLLGSAYFNKSDFVKAAEAYEKAAAIKPGAADIQRSLGMAYAELKETEKAEAALKKAFEAGGDAESAYLLGKLYYGARRFDEALAFALKAIQKDGKSAKAYNLKGVTLNQLERYAEAAGSFEAGLLLAPKDLNLQVNLGIAYLNSGQTAKAKATFEAVLPKIEQDVMRKQVEGYLQFIKDAGK